MSENTLSHRLDLLLGSGLIDSEKLVGDLSWRTGPRRWQRRLRALMATVARSINGAADPVPAEPPRLLALDWSGGEQELILGRDPVCDLVFTLGSVSRRHARLVCRDGSWVIQDLQSRNGTEVNGVAVGRCELRPGDHVVLGDEHLVID
ncbi:MAG TPA: FHA domain-containing protein [Solirubrobacteraceae bacterium]|nr:FHA domain-containing protein [Solirubrobacteraceae bacterium]